MSDPVRQATHTTRRLPTLAGIWLCVALATSGCGAGHSSPAGDRTDSLPDAPGAAAARRATLGADLYVTAGCFSCHSTDGTPLVGPSFRGLADSTVTLANGRHVKATRAYLRRAISDPGADIVRGYSSQAMTAAVGRLHLDRRPADIEALVEFITMIGP